MLPHSRPTLARSAQFIYAAIAFSVLSSLSAHAQTTTPQAPQAPRAPTANDTLGDFTNGQGTSANRLQLPKVNGTIGLKLRQSEAQDDDTQGNGDPQEQQARLRRDSGKAEVQLTLYLRQSLGTGTDFVGQLEFNTLRYSDEKLNDDEFNDDGEDEFAFDLKRAHLNIRPSRNLTWRLGRFGITDPMETIVNEDLDGLSVSYQRGFTQFDLSHTREDWFFASSGNREQQVSNTMASIRFSPENGIGWMPYVLHRVYREDLNPDYLDSVTLETTTWIGIQGIVNPDNAALRYWFHGSIQDGAETETDNNDLELNVTELGGFAVDAGMNWNLGGYYETTLTIAAAHASGVSKPNRYRQSGLHSNEFRLNGKNKFNYLGEVLNPELTNIQIFTLGVGTQLSLNITADLALHAYRQVEFEENKLRGSDIDYNTNGIDNDIGSGADLILSYQPNEATSIKAIAGRFIPGEAFRLAPEDNSRRTHAWVSSLEIEYRF